MLQGFCKWVNVLVFAGGLSILMTGCGSSISQQIMDTFIEDEYICSFYGKGVQVECVDGMPIQTTEFTEWKDGNSNYRIDVTSSLERNYYKVFSGNDTEKESESIDIRYIYKDDKLQIYYPEKNEYLVKNITLIDATQSLMKQGINTLTVDDSAKTYTMSIISRINQDYDVEIEDDVKLNGVKTQHVIAIPKDQKNFNEKLEIWIDQSTWLIIKEHEEVGNYMFDYEYLEYKINPSIGKKTFDMTVKEGATEGQLGPKLERVDKAIPVKEAPSYLEGAVYYLPQGEKLALVSCKYIEYYNLAKGIVTFTYHTASGREILVENRPPDKIYNQIDIGYEKLAINGVNCQYYENESGKAIRILSDDVICEISVRNSEITKNELIAYTKLLKKLKS